MKEDEIITAWSNNHKLKAIVTAAILKIMMYLVEGLYYAAL